MKNEKKKTPKKWTINERWLWQAKKCAKLNSSIDLIVVVISSFMFTTVKYLSITKWAHFLCGSFSPSNGFQVLFFVVVAVLVVAFDKVTDEWTNRAKKNRNHYKNGSMEIPSSWHFIMYCIKIGMKWSGACTFAIQFQWIETWFTSKKYK